MLRPASRHTSHLYEHTPCASACSGCDDGLYRICAGMRYTEELPWCERVQALNPQYSFRAVLMELSAGCLQTLDERQSTLHGVVTAHQCAREAMVGTQELHWHMGWRSVAQDLISALALPSALEACSRSPQIIHMVSLFKVTTDHSYGKPVQGHHRSFMVC